MAGEHIIEVHDLVKTYDGRSKVLDGVTFSVTPGELVTIFGRSGCGKTTLLNLLGGLDRPTSGSIFIDGIETTALSEEELAEFRLKKIGFVFQDYNLIPELTIADNLALPLKFARKRDFARVNIMLKEFGLEHIARATPNRISGGEAQRAAVARALMNEPEVILADEPTGNLDDENAEIVMGMFERARKEFGTTVLVATHDRALAARSTSMIHLADGKMTETAPRQ